MKKIEPATVERDEYGFWTHPDFPEWDESVTMQTVEAWLTSNDLDFHVTHFEHDANDEMLDRWFEGGECDCTNWEPTAPEVDHFLLSIHDTEDGPIALFAIKKEVNHAQC